MHSYKNNYLNKCSRFNWIDLELFLTLVDGKKKKKKLAMNKQTKSQRP